MKRTLHLIILLLLSVLAAQAQRKNTVGGMDESPLPANEHDTIALQRMAAHVAVFGQNLPQEKVYVHMDNTCYFLGDTIWFAAYTQQTNLDIPSTISRVLYAELYNQDGYLMERQLIKMENGRGHGQFVLQGLLYSGYYELRAYTRWQLNWGVTEHPHTDYAKDWFFNEKMYKDYYRDYDKLYSRVFPVYDKPEEEGLFLREMTARPLRRYFKDDLTPPDLVLSLFPESGQLVADAECRIAFEAANEHGEWKSGRVELRDKDDNVIATAPTENRGRGMLRFTPKAGERYDAVFLSAELDTVVDPSRRQMKHLTVKERLPKAEVDGVALAVDREEGGWCFTVAPKGAWAAKALGLTVMHQGVLEGYRKVQDASPAEGVRQIHFPASKLKPGVNQVTVFDAEGNVLADRLFFVTEPQLYTPTLSVKGLKERYKAFEPIEIDIESNAAPEAGKETTISLAVRDAVMQDYTYDSGNIMTEMLLASEIKGYVPQPEWFFQADDEEHQRGLELLMMTQGWRRFEWNVMALPYAFRMDHPAEYTQVLNGEVYRYSPFQKEDPGAISQLVESLSSSGWGEREIQDEVAMQYGITISVPARNTEGSSEQEVYSAGDPLSGVESGWTDNDPDIESQPMNSVLAKARYMKTETNLKKEVLVHAEFFRPGDDGLEGEVDTDGGTFTMPAPDFEGDCFVFLAASDSAKWRTPDKKASNNIYRRIKQTHQWVSKKEDDFPEFYVRINYPYPRFVKPYDYYHRQLAELVSDLFSDDLPGVEVDRLHRTLNAVTVRAKRSGLRAFDPTKPVFGMDAYDAFNATVDAGFSPAYYSGPNSIAPNLARTFVGDMNYYRAYGVEVRLDQKNSSHNNFAIPSIYKRYAYLSNLDSVYFYTDYAPREEGSERYTQDNQPTVTVDLRSMPNEGVRATYRDRRILLSGFAVAEDFYHPDYKMKLPEEGHKDYRRTLYWNPELPLNEGGRTRVTLYNNGKLTSVNVQAAGMTSGGKLLYTQ